MSATADAGLFAGYFEAALGEPSGQLTIPGFTHPVTGGRGGGAGIGEERLSSWRGRSRTASTCGHCLTLSRPLLTPIHHNQRADKFLEDALEATGFMVGRTSK